MRVRCRLMGKTEPIKPRLSGSGKSSLLFDTIAAEAQRQLNETFAPHPPRNVAADSSHDGTTVALETPVGQS
jgi:hypothetical protein